MQQSSLVCFFSSSFLPLLCVLLLILRIPSGTSLHLQIAAERQQSNEEGVGGGTDALVQRAPSKVQQQQQMAPRNLDELLSRHQLSPSAQLLLDRNAFRMSFGKRAAPSGIGTLLNRLRQEQQRQRGAIPLGLVDGNTFRMSFGKRVAENGEEGGGEEEQPLAEEEEAMGDSRQQDEGDADEEHAEMLTHANIAIPLLFDLDSGNIQLPAAVTILDESASAAVDPSSLDSAVNLLAALDPEFGQEGQKGTKAKQKQQQQQRQTSLFRKRLDRNLYNIGFGKRRRK